MVSSSPIACSKFSGRGYVSGLVICIHFFFDRANINSVSLNRDNRHQGLGRAIGADEGVRFFSPREGAFPLFNGRGEGKHIFFPKRMLGRGRRGCMNKQKTQNEEHKKDSQLNRSEERRVGKECRSRW